MLGLYTSSWAYRRSASVGFRLYINNHTIVRLLTRKLDVQKYAAAYKMSQLSTCDPNVSHTSLKEINNFQVETDLKIEPMKGTSFLKESPKMCALDIENPAENAPLNENQEESNEIIDNVVIQTHDQGSTNVMLEAKSKRKKQRKKKKRFCNLLPTDFNQVDQIDKTANTTLLTSSSGQPITSFKNVLNSKAKLFDADQSNEIEANKIFDKAAKFYEDKREAEKNSNRGSVSPFDWNSAMAMIKETESQFPSKVLSR